MDSINDYEIVSEFETNETTKSTLTQHHFTACSKCDCPVSSSSISNTDEGVQCSREQVDKSVGTRAIVSSSVGILAAFNNNDIDTKETGCQSDINEYHSSEALLSELHRILSLLQKVGMVVGDKGVQTGTTTDEKSVSTDSLSADTESNMLSSPESDKENSTKQQSHSDLLYIPAESLFPSANKIWFGANNY